ncbi:MAG: hypothetical protein GTO45_36595 [Candidatus Aminicenantes bacterium]|nr:hypothetical protein [Candidatus Aminicenantes bacterium]NIM84222.1 hypothetical protein [Candidatus Aminicenantes bacterium]NIN23671.1 hypothetical protein [Candidatus Aminicenantes bacterium]NIN47378.1 hypothetical protein [Candidatus Aminicenantes bacterium]NIN90306.1 hypothetical protein [Candidatus Aminicenantes bacterium]
MKKLVLFYISVRTIITAFYDVYPIPGFRATELIGAIFPIILLVYYFERHPPLSRSQKKIFLLISWALFSSLIVLLNFGVNAYVIFKQFFKLLNGFAVFIAFPLIFRNNRDVNLLINAFLISTIFPALQITAQYLIGADFLGLKAHVSGDITLYSGVYGNHGVFGIISWMGLLSIITKLGVNNKKNRLLYVSLFIFYLLVGFTTFSRTIMVLMLVILFGFILLLVRSKKGGILLLTICLVLLAVISPVAEVAYENIKKRSLSEIEILRGERDIIYGLHGRVGRWDSKLTVFLQEYSIFEQMIGTDLSIGPHGDYFSWLFSYGFIGLLLYLSFIISLLFYVKTRLKRVISVFHKYYGAAVFLGIIIWIIMAISTNPSFMPDFGYFVLGNSTVFLFITRKRYNNNSTVINKKNEIR